MEEKLTDIAIDLLLSGIEKKVNDIKEDFQWKRLFVNTGSFFTENLDKLKSFEKDLFVIFSKENMRKMASKLKDKRGYEFPQLLHNELYDLLIRYEVSVRDAETYIHHFSQVIINHLVKNDHDKTLEMYLGSWRDQEQKHFSDINFKLEMILKTITDLKKMEVSSCSISDIDAQIRKESKINGMDLSFFELDDEQFETKLQAVIECERIYVVGKSREETIYRILNELREKNSDKITLVIKSENEWKRLENANLSGAILIPFFFAESILAIRNNTNIFVYGEDEPCYSRDKLELRKRTKKSLIYSLEKIGVDGTEAYNMVDNTHGLYVPLKKKLFNGAMYSRPEWIKGYSSVIMAALLCGKWTDADGDKLIFEELAGKKYEECKEELSNYSHGENPFVVTYNGYAGDNMQLASVEDAWEELDLYITNKMWNKYIELFYEVLIESEPIFEYPFEKHFEASVYAKKPEWSPTLKKGMIRTLIMRAYYRSHAEYQTQIDKVVGEILETITTKERWGYISQYITDLCEASPNAVLTKLEGEFHNSSGLIDFFNANTGDFITGRHYYTHVLWAVEQLLQQKKYVARAVQWLWKMNSYEIKHDISNSTKSVLEVVFCAWLNTSALSVDNKIDLAKKALGEYDNAWEIIESKLPNSSAAICSTLNSPQYRAVDEPEDLYIYEVNKTYVEYLRMCTDAIGTNTDKWKKIIEHLHWYNEEVQNEILEKIVSACKQMSDYEKMQIKNDFRYLIYRHRYFVDADWSTHEVQLKKYEKLLTIIVTEEHEYEYVYLFSSEFEFPLLNPVPYHREEESKDYRTKNELLREREIKSKLKEFIDKNYSLEKLIEIAIQNNKSIIGDVLARFYCDEIYDEKVFELLLKKDKEGMHIYNYARTLYYKQAIELRELLAKVRQLSSNQNLIVNLIALQVIDDYKNAIIANENEAIKKEYWSKNLRFRIPKDTNEKTCTWALNECYKYGTLDSYVELLFDLEKMLQPIQIYEYAMKIYELQSSVYNSMTEYCLKEILKILQDCFINEVEMCQEIAGMEWYCRNILEWEQMRCTQYMMKSDPTIYAGLIKIIYKGDPNEEIDKERADLANKLYDGFSKAQFCPAEKDGKVKYEELKEWIEEFKKLLINQKQERFFERIVGRLLSYSPIGEDGYMPCEAVRKVIEEIYSESLKNSYVIAEENKRGVHTVDAGKSEFKLHEKYKRNAEALQYKYPHTADIYFALSDSYMKQAEWERKRAEDEW